VPTTSLLLPPTPNTSLYYFLLHVAFFYPCNFHLSVHLNYCVILCSVPICLLCLFSFRSLHVQTTLFASPPTPLLPRVIGWIWFDVLALDNSFVSHQCLRYVYYVHCHLNVSPVRLLAYFTPNTSKLKNSRFFKGLYITQR
jgi:hypothetical protein